MCIICNKTDCLHNWPGNKCGLKSITIGPDITCQDYKRPGIKLRNDEGVTWDNTQENIYPYTTASHPHHEDWRNDQ